MRQYLAFVLLVTSSIVACGLPDLEVESIDVPSTVSRGHWMPGAVMVADRAGLLREGSDYTMRFELDGPFAAVCSSDPDRPSTKSHAAKGAIEISGTPCNFVEEAIIGNSPSESEVAAMYIPFFFFLLDSSPPGEWSMSLELVTADGTRSNVVSTNFKNSSIPCDPDCSPGFSFPNLAMPSFR